MRWRRGVPQRLVAMVAEVVRFSEKTWLIEVSDKMKAFAMELCRNIEEKGKCNKDAARVEKTRQLAERNCMQYVLRYVL